jgi:hypothetical protein
MGGSWEHHGRMDHGWIMGGSWVGFGIQIILENKNDPLRGVSLY